MRGMADLCIFLGNGIGRGVLTEEGQQAGSTDDGKGNFGGKKAPRGGTLPPRGRQDQSAAVFSR